MPPGTTIPPWTPPVPPPPSQTNMPSPVPFATPGALGGAPGALGGPRLTIPGAFSPTVATVRGAALEFHPTLRLSEEYSDNFFQTTSRAEDNFRSILGPGFTVLLNGARTFGSLATTVDLVHDTVRNSGDEIKVFPSVAAAIRYGFTPRLSFTVTDSFVRNDSAATVDPFGLRQGRQTFDTNTLTVALDWVLERIAAQVFYRNVLFINEGSGGSGNGGTGNTSSNQNDTISQVVGINGATRIATDYIVRAGYEFGRTDNLDGSSSTTGGDTFTHTVFASAARQFGLFTTAGLSSSYSYQTENSTSIYNASLFGAYGLPTGLSVSGAVGYSILDSDTQDSEGAVSANATVSYRFTRAVIAVGVFQDFRQTGQQGQNFGTVESRSYFGSFLYQLTPFLNSTLQVTYSENQPTGTGNANNGQTQATLTYGASVNWQILRWLAASLRYTYTKQTGNSSFNQGSLGTGDYAENRASLNLFATF
jgi:hypothetical protein